MIVLENHLQHNWSDHFDIGFHLFFCELNILKFLPVRKFHRKIFLKAVYAPGAKQDFR